MLHGTTLIILPPWERHLSRPVTGTRRSAPRGLLQSGCSAPVAEGFHRFPLASGPFAKLTFSSRFTRDIISQISFLSSNRSSQQRYRKNQVLNAHNFSLLVLSNFDKPIWPPSYPMVGSLCIFLFSSPCSALLTPSPFECPLCWFLPVTRSVRSLAGTPGT